MKKIVMSFSTSSRMSWLQFWKQMHSRLSVPISTCWRWEETQREVETRRYSKNSWYHGKKRSKVVYLKIQIQWILFYGALENWDWTPRRDTPWNSQDAPGTKLKFGIIQKGEPHERNRCAPGFEDQPPEETSQQAGCTSKVAWNLARKYASSGPEITTFCSPVKAPETQKIVCLLWIRELQCTMLSKETWAQIQWIFWGSPKNHVRLTATGSNANKRVSTSFVHDFDLFVTVQLLDETPVILLLHKLCSKRGYSYEWKTAKTPQLAKNCGKAITGQHSTSRCIKTVIIFQQHFVFNIEVKGSVQLFQKFWEHHQILCRLEVTSMHAENRCWQIMTSRPRGTVNQQTRRTRRLQCKAFLFGYSPSQLI